MNNFQQKGSHSNTHVGGEFEVRVASFSSLKGLFLDKRLPLILDLQMIKSPTNGIWAPSLRELSLSVSPINGRKLEIYRAQRLQHGIKPCSSCALHLTHIAKYSLSYVISVERLVKL